MKTTEFRQTQSSSGKTRRPDLVFKTVRLANHAERLEAYDFLGRLQHVEEPDDSWLRYSYRDGGLLTRIEHSSGQSVRFHRTPHRIRAVTDRTQTTIRFDNRNFPDRITVRADGHEWTIDYRRDARGQVVAIRYPQSDDWLTVGPRLTCAGQVYAEIEWPRLRLANGTTATEDWGKIENPKLERISHHDAHGSPVFDQTYDYEESGKLSRAGRQSFTYDTAGRLTACGARSYEFDADGRMTRAGTEEFRYGSAPHVMETDSARFEYDALGRRAAKWTAEGVTRYTYNLFGQLASVQLPNDSLIRYLYDGFGRLVGRETEQDKVYYILDFDGHRIAECDASGKVTRSYLWVGPRCVGLVDGPCGRPMVQSFHCVHGGTVIGIGDSLGRIRFGSHSDPYGADMVIVDGIPGYAGLFGDPVTGLLHASSRWLDPTIGQFITADSWFGTDSLERLPRGMRRIFDSLPGGTGRVLSPASAYDWCSRDPVNFCDPNGHNFMGLIWSFISFFLWSMQVTSIALQMEIVSLMLFILFTFPGFMPAWNLDFWKKISPWNAIPPLLGSSRLMVPFCFPLNSLWNASGAVFTMGSVIWARGDQLETLEKTAQRDLIVCSNASTYRASTEEAAADMYRARSPNARGTATANAAGNQLTGAAVTTPPGAPIGNVFRSGDWLSIKLPGAAQDELRNISGVPAPNTFDLNNALPAAMQGQAVEIIRLDVSIVRLQKDDLSLARTIRFVRGQAIHIQSQIPEGLATEGLAVTEFMPAGQRKTGRANAPRLPFIVRLAVAGDQALFAANDFVRVRANTTYVARVVGRLRAARDLILDTPLPPAAYSRLEVVKMDTGEAPVANQTSSGSRVNVGTLAALRRLDGLAITNTGGAPVTVERRIVTGVHLSCPIAALPNPLHSQPIAVDLMTADAATRAAGSVTANNQIATTAGEAGRFSNDQPVRVRKAPSTDFFTTVTNVDAGANRLTLADPLPAADFPNTTAVSVHLMTAIRRLTAEPSAPPGDQVTLQVDQPGSPAQNDVLRVRTAAAVTGGVLRQVNAPPTVVAELDSVLPGTHLGNLSVQRMAPDANTLKDNASAPMVQLRFEVVSSGGVNPYGVGEELHLSDRFNPEEACGKVATLIAPSSFELEHPVDFDLGTSVDLEAVVGTGSSTPDGKLQESLILIPSDPGEEPITRRRAVEAHEMRHVWQYAVLGPFFFSLPLPWLFHLGFSFGDSANSEMKLARHFSVGAVDSLFALIAWGVGSLFGAAPSGADVEGEITDTERKTVTLPGDTDPNKVAAFTEGSPCEVAKAGYDTFNIIEHLNIGEKKVTFRFPLESDKFAVNDRVKVSVSPFEKIRSDVNKWFSLNLERLWSDHIPVAWGRALSKFLNRDSWFPLLGLYPIAFLRAGGNQGRMHFEQDASYHSGDLYSDIAISDPPEVFVGQFSRVFGFMMGRGGGDTATGLSDVNPLEFLTITPPPPPPVTPPAIPLTPTEMVFGSVAANIAGRVRFREQYYMRMSDRVENAVGAFFAASQQGEYRLHVPGELTEELVNTIAFDADFTKLRTIKVKPLAVTPAATAADPIFETELVQFSVGGDPAADYGLRYLGAAPVPPVLFDPGNRLRVTAPVLAAGATVHRFQITATYDARNKVFHGSGQLEPIGLTADQLTNVCQTLEMNIAPLTAPVVGAVQAGRTMRFQVPIAPASVRVTSPTPAGAAINASVINGTGRPAQLTFNAPDAVTAAVVVTIELVFGSGAATKPITVPINVTP